MFVSDVTEKEVLKKSDGEVLVLDRNEDGLNLPADLVFV